MKTKICANWYVSSKREQELSQEQKDDISQARMSLSQHTKLPNGWIEDKGPKYSCGAYTAFYKGKIRSGVGSGYWLTHPGAIYIKRANNSRNSVVANSDELNYIRGKIKAYKEGDAGLRDYVTKAWKAARLKPSFVQLGNTAEYKELDKMTGFNNVVANALAWKRSVDNSVCNAKVKIVSRDGSWWVICPDGNLRGKSDTRDGSVRWDESNGYNDWVVANAYFLTHVSPGKADTHECFDSESAAMAKLLSLAKTDKEKSDAKRLASFRAGGDLYMVRGPAYNSSDVVNAITRGKCFPGYEWIDPKDVRVGDLVKQTDMGGKVTKVQGSKFWYNCSGIGEEGPFDTSDCAKHGIKICRKVSGTSTNAVVNAAIAWKNGR